MTEPETAEPAKARHTERMAKEGEIVSDSAQEVVRASRIGGQVGVGCVAVAALTLSYLILPSVSLIWVVLGMAIPQAVCAWRVGLRIGPRIASGTTLAAAPFGMLAGLIVLCCTALAASGVGLCWGLWDGIRGSDWAYSYIGKPFLAVIFYGCFFAISLGLLAGLLIRMLTAGAR